MRSVYTRLLPAALSLSLWACTDDGAVGLDNEQLSGVVMTDTISIEMATVYGGPIPTSNRQLHLVGNYRDPELGRISSRSYFKISPQTPNFALNRKVDEDIRFDSIALIIRCKGYYYGDTTAWQEMRVYELLEEIEAEELPDNPEGLPRSYFAGENQLYAGSHFEFDEAAPLATKRIRPRPSLDTLHIRLPDALGREWMRLSAENDVRISNAEEFSEYFKGLVLEGNPEDNAALVAYRADTSFVRLYYREKDVEGSWEERFADFTAYQGELQFNEISTDHAGTALEGLGPSRRLIPSPLTSERTYLQAGTGIMTKLTFPYLRQFIETAGDSSLTVHSAQLLIKPVAETIKAGPALPRLVLYHSDEHNLPLYPLTDDLTGGANTGVFYYDEEFPDQTWYKFYLTGYFSQALNRYRGAPEILLVPSEDELYTTVNRLCLGSGRNQRYRAQLILYYTPADF